MSLLQLKYLTGFSKLFTCYSGLEFTNILSENALFKRVVFFVSEISSPLLCEIETINRFASKKRTFQSKLNSCARFQAIYRVNTMTRVYELFTVSAHLVFPEIHIAYPSFVKTA